VRFAGVLIIRRAFAHPSGSGLDRIIIYFPFTLYTHVCILYIRCTGRDRWPCIFVCIRHTHTRRYVGWLKSKCALVRNSKTIHFLLVRGARVNLLLHFAHCKLAKFRWIPFARPIRVVNATELSMVGGEGEWAVSPIQITFSSYKTQKKKQRTI